MFRQQKMMKRYSTYHYLILGFLFHLVVLISCSSCDPSDDDLLPCEEPQQAEDIFCFDLYEAETNELLLCRQGCISPYDPDKVQLLNEQLFPVSDFSIPPCFQAVSLAEDSTGFVERVDKSFFLALDSLDRDTIRFSFRLVYVPECFVTQFDSLDIYYNQDLMYSSDGRGGWPFISFKK
ncbi:MAG: hypothetical protein AAF990_12565 [Bacteroidota bacterium]